MPYKDISRRRACGARCVREHRMYLAAVRAGDPLALEAERERQRARNPMGPVNALEKRLALLSPAEREQYRAEHAALRRACVSVDTAAASARYRELKRRVVANARRLKEIFS